MKHLKLSILIIGIFIVSGLLFMHGNPVAFVSAQESLDPTRPYNPSVSILENLKNRDPKSKATIKGLGIANMNIVGIHTNIKYGITLDIQSIKAIDGGVELFAKAFKNGKQLGFGKDGSVDIERYRIKNPPILIQDSNGKIVRKYIGIDGIIKNRLYREDPLEALLQTMAHSSLLLGKENTIITKGKIGRTHTVYYSTVGVNSPVDGYAERNSANSTWSSLQSGAGTSANDTSTELLAIFEAGSTTDRWNRLFRSILLFDTSDIPDIDGVTSAILFIFGTTKQDSDSNTPDSNIYAATPATSSAIASGDYSNTGTTAFSTAKSYSSWVNSYNDFILNANGLAAIDITGISKFSWKNVNYDVANSAPTWSSGTQTGQWGKSADTDGAGTDSDPKLVVEHSDATAPVISNLQSSNVTNDAALITWTTDEAATSKVTYGTSTPVASSTPITEISDLATTTSHSINLASLEAGATYYYVAVSVDELGNIATSTESSFTTLESALTFAHKSQDQFASSTDKVFVDADLRLTLDANSSYVVTAAITASSTATQPDIKTAFNVPADASMALTFGSFDGTAKVAGSGLFSSTTTRVLIDLPSTGLVVMHIDGVITTGATAGFLEFKWSQNTSHTTRIRVFKGSYLRAEKIQ